ncbi:MAG: hypothetical protein MRY79_04780 [Alphaproteobacteria bacterium]|nr:hypothetical protein [Alphaproteobacteria bacterium]
MYMDNNWNPVQGEELAGFLEQINPIGNKYSVNPATTLVEWRPLPFYDQVALIRVKDPAWTPQNLFIYYLTDQGNLYWLNGTSPPIHDVNAKAPVKITDDNVLEYLRFFCFFVRGDEGPFLIAESMEDTYIPKQLDDKTRTVIEGVLRPASFEGKDENGNWLCDGVVYYSNAMFIANFSVQPSGMIEMLDDEPIAADLPVKVDAPVA